MDQETREAVAEVAWKAAVRRDVAANVYQSSLEPVIASRRRRTATRPMPSMATHVCKHPAYRARHERTKRRLGRQRGPKIANVDTSRRLAHAIWHMLTRNESFAPAGATPPLAA
jgi:hypothetical protein